MKTQCSTTPIPYIHCWQVRRLLRLLYMKYRPYEIAEILGVSTHTIYTYFLAGCPHSRDDHGDFWIVGTEFREWVDAIATTKKNSPKPPLAYNETYCAQCKKRVTMLNTTLIVPTDIGISVTRGKCSICRGGVVKAFVNAMEDVQ